MNKQELIQGNKIIVERLPTYACNASNAQHKQTIKTITAYNGINQHIKLNKKYFHVLHNKHNEIVFSNKTAKYMLIKIYGE